MGVKGSLASPRFALVCAALAFVLSLPSLFGGYAADDYVHRVYLQRAIDFGPYDRPWWMLFTFFDGNRERTHWLIDHGICSWWADLDVRASFFRPVSAATHLLDIRAWPNAPELQHLHSILWYVALVALVAKLFRRLLGPTWIAGLAALFYCVDPTHGIPIGWLANRNATVAAVFAMGAFSLFVARRTFAATVVYALAFASGESALGALAFFFGHSLFLDDRPRPERLRSLAPLVAVVAVWAVTYRALGFGVAHSGLYLEPLREPVGYAAAVAVHLPLLVSAELGAPSPEPYAFFDLPQRAVLLVVAAAFVAWTASAVWRIVRSDARARFFVFAGVVSILPSCATFPSGRLLLIPSVAWMGLLALVVEAEDRGRALRSFRWWTLFSRLALAPLTFQIAIQQMRIFNRVIDRFAAGIPAGAAETDTRLVVVNAPDTTFIVYCLVARRSRGDLVPQSLLTLGPGSRPMSVTRRDERTLVVRVDDGFFRKATEILTRKPSRPMPVGTRVDLTSVTIDITHTLPDGVPDEATFRFADDPSRYTWREWSGDHLVPFALPSVGETRVYPGRLPPLW